MQQPQLPIHGQTVAFICSANLCRSLMAQAIFAAETKKRGIAAQVISAGLYDFEGVLAAREARLACDRHQSPMPKFVSTYFRNVDLSAAIRVFVMS
jgi:protein-tyrosine-phosphatase